MPTFLCNLGLGDWLRQSEKPSEYIGVTFSILAATLFAVISIVGDPSMILAGSWKTAWNSAKEIQIRLVRLKYLFLLYLVVLTLLIATEIVKFMKFVEFYWVYDVFGWMTVFSLIASYWLPFEIVQIQTQRLNDEITARKGRH